MLINYLERRIEKECKNVRDGVRCCIQVLEDVKARIEGIATSIHGSRARSPTYISS